MSDEERKAIEHLKNYPINWLIENVNESAIKIVLNLIEKQSKEIEELNKSDASKEQLVHRIKAKIEELKKKYDKLRDCEVFQKAMYTFGIELLQSLLEKE